MAARLGQRDRVMAYLDLMAEKADGADHPLQLPYRVEVEWVCMYMRVGGGWSSHSGLSDQNPPKDPSTGPSLCTHLHIDVQLLTMTLLRGWRRA